MTDIDPLTGEVIDRATLITEHLAIVDATREAWTEFERLQKLRNESERQVIRVLGVDGGAITPDGRAVAVIPGAPGRRTVDKHACEAWKEQLIAAGVGKETKAFQPPTLAQLNEARAELTARGVPVSTLITKAPAGQPALKIVDTTAGATS